MDKLSELSTGAKIVLGASIAFLVVSFFNWQEVDLGPLGDAGVSMWNGIGWLAGLSAIALIAWQVLRLAGVNVEVGVTPAMVTTALSGLLLLFTVIKFLTDGEFRTIWAWLGLLLAVAVAVGAFLSMQESGESFQSMRDQVTTMTSSRGGAAASTGTTTTPAPPPAPESAETMPNAGQSVDDAVDEVRDDEPPADRPAGA